MQLSFLAENKVGFKNRRLTDHIFDWVVVFDKVEEGFKFRRISSLDRIAGGDHRVILRNATSAVKFYLTIFDSDLSLFKRIRVFVVK